MNVVGRPNRCKSQIENPSFSSTLLEVIYRSIDERDEEESAIYRKLMRKRQSIDGCSHKEDIPSVRRSGGSNSIDQVESRRNSATGLESSSHRSDNNSRSNVVSSCSRHPVGLFSSETETIYGFPVRPRPIRTSTHTDTREKHTSKFIEEYRLDNLQSKAKREGKFVKTKARAMKIYGYLKNGRQPISPGGRLASFLLSLFTTGNAKKSTCTGGDGDAIVHANRKSKSANASTSSCACSVSRLHLSKTPTSSSGKLTTGMKTSGRFFPSSVVIDEHSQLCRHSSLHGDRSNSPDVKFVRNSINEELKKHFTEKTRRIEVSTRNLLKNYQKNAEYVFDSIKVNITQNDDDYNNDDEDDASYASSDLFELDHLSAIGIDRCKQELPLYETTSVDANRAIANGLM